MLIALKRWGNSTSLRIPSLILESLNLKVDDQVEVREENGQIIIVPVRENELNLAEMMSRVTPENIHARIDFGKPVGNELI